MKPVTHFLCPDIRAVRIVTFTLVLLGALVTVHARESTPEGLESGTIDSIEQLLEEKMAKDRIPGLSIAVLADGKIAWSNGYGFADLENDVPATASTVYRTASIGKTLTATAVMQLAERGLLDIDTPIQQYCSAFPVKQAPLTTRHLLTHTSGIRHYGGFRNEEELFNNRHYDNVISTLDIFKDDQLLFEPGTRYLYSTFGYVVLGCVIEGAAGTDYVNYMRRNVFEPAAMTSTRADDPSAIIPKRSRGYRLTAEGNIVNSRAVDMSSKLPAGGFVTTAEDLVKFAGAVMDHRIMSAATLDWMLKPARLKSGEIIPYGLGWGLFPGEDWYGFVEAFHGGSTPQVSGVLYMLPEARFAIALMTNLEGVPGRTELAAQVARLVLGLGKSQP